MSPTWPWTGRPHRLLASGRQALAWLVTGVMPPRARVLCPACMCGSVAAGIAAAGAEAVFYSQDSALHPRWDELAAAPADAVLLVHPLGRRLPVAPVRALKRQRPDLVVVEDISHTLLNRAPLIGVDFAFASLRKLLPVADGGVAIDCRGRPLPEAPPASPAPSPFVRKRLAGDPSAEDDLDAWGGPPDGIWEGTLRALAALEPAAPRRARRRRYRQLAELAAGPDVVPLWPRLPDGVAPLALPLRCRNRHDLRRRLQREGVAAQPYWPVPEAARDAAGIPGRLLAGTLLLVMCAPGGQALGTGSGERPARGRAAAPARGGIARA